MYRSRRNADRGLETAALLDAAASMDPLLTFRFAVDRRVRPFNEWLDWELTERPFDGDAWERARLLDRLGRITATGSATEQVALFRDVELLAREHGLGETVDGWEPDVAWLRGE